MLSLMEAQEMADMVFNQGYIHSFMISIRCFITLDLDKNTDKYDNNNF